MKKLDYSIILDTDSYKLSHFLGYPPEVKRVYSYAEARGGRYPSVNFFGLQPYLQMLATTPITAEDIDEAEEFAKAHGEPFNREGWEIILNEHGGFLPLEIKAVPEGTLVPTRNVLCTVVNTDERLPWLTSYVETPLLRQTWYPTTVATRIFNMKKRIKEHFEKTSDEQFIGFALLDFSARGCSSYGANELGGAAYLAHFLGSDSVGAVRFVNNHYFSDMSGFSVPATEHSIMCSWGLDREGESFIWMIDKMGGKGKIVSVVSDTWNIFDAAKKWAALALYVKNSGTTLVVRPDSGDAEVVLPQVLNTLAAGFGYTTNSKGLKVLDGVKVLWGDGIDEESHMRPFHVAWDAGFAPDNIITGSGGGLMQADIDRDTSKFAFKASAIFQNGGWRGIAKNPITDPGKASKKGLLALIKNEQGLFETVNPQWRPGAEDHLRVVYRDGKLYNEDTIDTIRQRIDAQL